MIMDIEELKNTWGVLNKRIERLEVRNQEMERKVREGRVKTYQQKNIRTMRIVSVVILMAIVFILLCGDMFSLRSKVMYVVFMLFGVGDCLYFIHNMKLFDFVRMSTPEIVAHSYKVQWRYNRNLIIGIVFCIPVLASLFYDMYLMDKYAVYGGIVGGVIGGVIGLKMQFEFKKKLKQIRKEFLDSESESNPDSDPD